MDDFYLYYSVDDASSYTGTIRAVSPHKLKKVDNAPFIRISSKKGLQLIRGELSLSDWFVQFNNDIVEMALTKRSTSELSEVVLPGGEMVKTVHKRPILAQIPTKQNMPELVIIYKKSSRVFHVKAESIVKGDLQLTVFATILDDPNLCYYQFTADLRKASKKEGWTSFPCPEPLPDKFSLYTKTIFDRCEFEIRE